MVDKKKNPVAEWWHNITHVRKNYKKVKASPYATLQLSIKLRQLIVWMLIPYIVYRGIKMILDYQVGGFMNLVGKIIMFCVFAYLVYRIWRTIPDAKKQIEYYKKYPHTINYCPTNVKEDVNDIIKKIKENKEKKDNEMKGGNENVQETKTRRS